jgi:hypothetical protein
MSFDFAAVSAPFRMQPGLRRLAAGAHQLTPNRPGDRALDEKLAVLMSHAHQALLCAPAFDAGPALQALATHAAPSILPLSPSMARAGKPAISAGRSRPATCWAMAPPTSARACARCPITGAARVARAGVRRGLSR